ncbi:uncharacterized protein LOC114940972 [Nylanderia fulva]|uniref:uncharacterized protein LOC114940972 n=1 Tax=Nylanderia fulva TaxID=613905 RepID=UPI0010FB3F43|nr:uncharacterized protein LOC114940972 [Nylanderia fulva]
MDRLGFFDGFRIIIINNINDDVFAENPVPLAGIGELLEDNGNDDEIENIAINAIVEIAEGFVQRIHRTCITNYIENTVPMYTDREFVMHFRLKRTLFMSIVEKFNHWPYFRNLGGNGGFKVVSAEKHILTFLWFAGHQSASFRDVADRFDLSLTRGVHDVPLTDSNEDFFMYST